MSADAGPPGPTTIVEPDQGSDTVDPPLEYRVDVTEAVRGWLAGERPNHGVALAPVPDRATDEGHHTRFQVYAREHQNGRHAPRLTVQIRGE
ncbi:MAG: DNRLRE domain-containing protein [Gemmataceae bacterium]